MGKFHESFGRRNEEMLKLGEENAEYIRNVRNWCKHFRVEMKSAGLLAEMSGLPIGSHAISCQYSEGWTEAMNLPWIIPEFIVTYCAGCQYHEPNGNTDWGEEIIKKHQQQLHEHLSANQIRQEQLRRLREELQELPRAAKESSEIDERQILIFIEELFSDDTVKQEINVDLLLQSARIGAELFSPVAIDILIDQSLSEEFALHCLPICAELADKREDLEARLESMAFKAIEQNIYPELAATVILRLDQKVNYPLSPKIIENLISNQNHSTLFNGWGGKAPSYPNTTKILARCYEATSSSVINPCRSRLQCDEKYIRVNVCGAIKLLQDVQPQIGIDLLSELVASLELYDDHYDDRADDKAKQRIAEVFRHVPSLVDDYLASEIYKKRPAVQEEIIGIYRELFWEPNRNWREKPKKNDEVRIEVKIALNRCLEFIKDESLEVNVRHTAAEALDCACSQYPQAVISHFDSLLGYYAVLCTQEKPPALLPQIILLGQETDNNPLLTTITEENRCQTWRFFKDKLLGCIKELAKYEPVTIGDAIINCYKNLETKTHKNLKSALITLSGEVGKNYLLQPRVLPLLMKALMDFDSQLVRASAIHTVEAMYRYSKSAPPKNIVDVLILHLRDEYVIVYKAAIHALQWGGSWLDRNQAIEALNLMLSWLGTYRKEPYFLEEICRAVLWISNHFLEFQNIVIETICNVLPTNEDLVDERIIEEIIGYLKPDEAVVELVARKIAWCLANYSRDNYHNGYDDSAREKMFNWLHQIPHAIYTSIRSELLDEARQLAVKDAWEASYFASLFAQYGDYIAEKEVLDIAVESLNGEKRYEKLQKTLRVFGEIAAANINLQNGKIAVADEAISKIGEIEI